MESKDSYIGNWLVDVPYIWVEGETLRDCKRFYILHPNACAVFDKENRISTKYEIEKAKYRKLDETFSIFPFDKEYCETVRNYFLVSNFPDFFWENSKKNIVEKSEKYDIRIGGKIIDVGKVTYSLLESGLVEISSQKENKIASVYPWIFGTISGIKSIHEPIQIGFGPGKILYNNLYILNEEAPFYLIKGVRKSHEEALVGALTIINKIMEQIIVNYIKKLALSDSYSPDISIFEVSEKDYIAERLEIMKDIKNYDPDNILIKNFKKNFSKFYIPRDMNSWSLPVQKITNALTLEGYYEFNNRMTDILNELERLGFPVSDLDFRKSSKSIKSLSYSPRVKVKVARIFEEIVSGKKPNPILKPILER